MKSIIKVMSVAILALVLNSGCASYMVMKGSEEQVAMKKALMTGNQKAVRSLQLGEGPVVAGIPVSKGEALAERPALQLGAGVLDIGMLWGGYEGIKAIDDGGSNDDEPTTYGDSAIVIKGDNNSVSVDRSSKADSNDKTTNTTNNFPEPVTPVTP